MIRSALAAVAVAATVAAGAVATAAPAAADVVVRVNPWGPGYARPVVVARPPVYVAPRAVYVAPRPVYVAPRAVYVAPRAYVNRCRTVQQKVVVRRPGPDVVRWRPVTRCW